MRLLATGEGDAEVVAAQIFGPRPEAMAAAAAHLAGAGFAVVDINLGCPAPKVRRQRAGVALMDEPAVLREVVRAVVAAAAPVPVTAKMRLGNKNADNAGDTAKLLYDEGVQALAVHGRTMAQGFRGAVNTRAIAEVVAAVPMPVWANGDVRTPADAAALLAATGAAGVMVGRAAVRRPYLIAHLESYLATGETPPAPTRAELAETILFHFDRAAALDGEERAARQFRKHLLAYFKGVPGAKTLRAQAARVSDRGDVAAALDDFQKLPDDGP